jgi:hypothetical protein
MKYRKKSVMIDAWQFTKKNYHAQAPRFIRHSNDVTLWSQYCGDVIGGEIKTLSGVVQIGENDWILKGVKGEFYPCKDDIFIMTYEPVFELTYESVLD